MDRGSQGIGMRLNRLAVCLAGILAALNLPLCWAGGQDPKPESPAAQPDAAPAAPKWQGFQLQLIDEPLTQFVPKTARTADEWNRVTGLSYWMVGQFHENRSNLAQAYEAYQQGLAVQPNSLVLVRKLMALAFSLNKPEEGVKFAQRAVELDPTDSRLLRRLASVLATEDPEAAINMLEKASQALDERKEPALRVTIQQDLGQLYSTLGKTKEAADCYAVVFDALQNPEKYDLKPRMLRELESDPQLGFERLGEVFLQADRLDLATVAFEKAAATRKTSPGNLAFNIAQVLLKQNKPQEALDKLQTYFDAQRQTKGRAAYALLANILHKLNQSSDLIPRLEKLADKDSKNADLQFYLAEQYTAAGQLDKAETLFKETLKRDADPEGYRGLAMVYRQQKKTAELISTLGKAFAQQKDPKVIETELKTIVADPELLGEVIKTGLEQIQDETTQLEFPAIYVLARLAAVKPDYPAVTRFYLAGIQMVENRPAEPGLAFRLYDEAGDLLMLANQFAEAVVLYQAAFNDEKQADNKLNWVYHLSRALEFAGKTDEALKTIATAQQQLNTSHPILQFQEGWIYYHAGKYDEAITRFEKFVKEPNQNRALLRQARLSLSNVYVLKGDLAKGEGILEELYKEEPDDPGINNDLGYLYADQGKNLDQAEKMLQKALKAEPDNPAYLDSYAWVLYKQKKYAEAAKHLEKAVEKPSGTDATLWDHLGDIYEQLQQGDKAIAAWKKALAASTTDARPDQKLVTRIQEKLKARTGASGGVRPAQPNSP